MKSNEKISATSLKSNESSSSLKVIKNRKVSSYIYSNYLPIYQSKVIKNLSSPGSKSNASSTNLSINARFQSKVDAAIQCNLIDYRMSAFLASNLTISSNAVFPTIYLKRLSKQVNNKLEAALGANKQQIFRKLSANSYVNSSRNNGRRPSHSSESFSIGLREIGEKIFS